MAIQNMIIAQFLLGLGLAYDGIEKATQKFVDDAGKRYVKLNERFTSWLDETYEDIASVYEEETGESHEDPYDVMPDGFSLHGAHEAILGKYIMACPECGSRKTRRGVKHVQGCQFISELGLDWEAMPNPLVEFPEGPTDLDGTILRHDTSDELDVMHSRETIHEACTIDHAQVEKLPDGRKLHLVWNKNDELVLCKRCKGTGYLVPVCGYCRGMAVLSRRGKLMNCQVCGGRGTGTTVRDDSEKGTSAEQRRAIRNEVAQDAELLELPSNFIRFIASAKSLRAAGTLAKQRSKPYHSADPVATMATVVMKACATGELNFEGFVVTEELEILGDEDQELIPALGRLTNWATSQLVGGESEDDIEAIVWPDESPENWTGESFNNTYNLDREVGDAELGVIREKTGFEDLWSPDDAPAFQDGGFNNEIMNAIRHRDGAEVDFLETKVFPRLQSLKPKDLEALALDLRALGKPRVLTTNDMGGRSGAELRKGNGIVGFQVDGQNYKFVRKNKNSPMEVVKTNERLGDTIANWSSMVPEGSIYKGLALMARASKLSPEKSAEIVFRWFTPQGQATSLFYMPLFNGEAWENIPSRITNGARNNALRQICREQNVRFSVEKSFNGRWMEESVTSSKPEVTSPLMEKWEAELEAKAVQAMEQWKEAVENAKSHREHFAQWVQTNRKGVRVYPTCCGMPTYDAR